MLPYKLHEKAYREYIEAYEWYEERQERLGDRFMNNVEKRLHQISEHPYHYPNKHGNYREAKVEDFPFMIVYEVFKQKQLIHIAAIYHGKRSPKSKYRKLKK
jgi:plasmid stabilization system protein ParE